MRYKESIKKAA